MRFDATGTGTHDLPVEEPEKMSVVAYPNPFSAETTIRITRGSSAEVRISVHDVLGRRVRPLLSGKLPPGEFSLTWDGRDGAGRIASSGAYFIQVEDGDKVITRGVLLVR